MAEIHGFLKIWSVVGHSTPAIVPLRARKGRGFLSVAVSFDGINILSFWVIFSLKFQMKYTSVQSFLVCRTPWR